MKAYCSECIGKAEIEAKSDAVVGVVFKSSAGPYSLPSQLCLSQASGVLPNLLSRASEQMKVKIYFNRQEAKSGGPWTARTSKGEVFHAHTVEVTSGKRAPH